MERPEQALPVLPCTCANLRRAARAATLLYERHLRGTGLNITQFTLLNVLDRVGPITQGGLGRALVLDSTTLSRTLRPLESKRWIRSEAGKDRRERRLELTGAGREQMAKATPAWNHAQAALRRGLGAQRCESISEELATLAGVAGHV